MCFKKVGNVNSQTDECCENPIMNNSNAPEPEYMNDRVYCYTKCINCGSLWRDKFIKAYEKKDYSGEDVPLLEIWNNVEFSLSRIDTNKLHNGIVKVVLTPSNDPLEEVASEVPPEIYEEVSTNEHKAENYRKIIQFVYSSSSVKYLGA